MVGTLRTIRSRLKSSSERLPKNSGERSQPGWLELLKFLLEPAYLSVLLLYKLAKIRVLQCQGIYLRVRLGQPLTQNSGQWHLFQNVSKESHNRKWPNDQTHVQPPERDVNRNNDVQVS